MLGNIDRGLALVSWLLATLVVVLLFAGPGLIGATKAGSVGYGSGSYSGAPSGAAVFASAGCAGCHTLKAAGATGTVGPDLDQVRPSASTVSSFVSSGGGVMPSFSAKLSPAQIAAVAHYVSSVAGS